MQLQMRAFGIAPQRILWLHRTVKMLQIKATLSVLLLTFKSGAMKYNMEQFVILFFYLVLDAFF